MFRRVALSFTLPMTAVAMTPSASALNPDQIRFSLEPEHRNPARIQARFESSDQGRDNNWSTGMMPSDLIGLEVSSFRAAGSRPLHFAIAREAGRLDCSGAGGNGAASGNCRFAADPAFLQLLAARGIGRPTEEQAFELMAVNVRRDVIDAVAAAHYPTPSIDNLTALAALGVNSGYIAGLAHAGCMPKSIQSLVEFKALGITPEWVSGLAKIGYTNVPGDGLVQMRALGITPDYVAGFQRIGYRDLSVERLVELKALDVTPEFVRAVVKDGEPMPPASRLVELRMFGRRR